MERKREREEIYITGAAVLQNCEASSTHCESDIAHALSRHPFIRATDIRADLRILFAVQFHFAPSRVGSTTRAHSFRLRKPHYGTPDNRRQSPRKDVERNVERHPAVLFPRIVSSDLNVEYEKPRERKRERRKLARNTRNALNYSRRPPASGDAYSYTRCPGSIISISTKNFYQFFFSDNFVKNHHL